MHTALKIFFSGSQLRLQQYEPVVGRDKDLYASGLAYRLVYSNTDGVVVSSPRRNVSFFSTRGCVLQALAAGRDHDKDRETFLGKLCLKADDFCARLRV